MFLVLLFFGPFVPFLAVSDPVLIQKHLFLGLFGGELGDLEKTCHGHISDSGVWGGGVISLWTNSAKYYLMASVDKSVRRKNFD